nr:AAA family ATPase [Clostridia bacterium]
VEMILFTGIQATGKSEFYKRYFYKTHIRINLDMLKTRHREKILVEACIAAKQPFVVDNTNPTAVDRQRYIAPAKSAGFKVVGYVFQSSVRDALARNGAREGREKVPQAAVLATHRKLEPSEYGEGFDALYTVRIDENGGFAVEARPDERSGE